MQPLDFIHRYIPAPTADSATTLLLLRYCAQKFSRQHCCFTR